MNERKKQNKTKKNIRCHSFGSSPLPSVSSLFFCPFRTPFHSKERCVPALSAAPFGFPRRNPFSFSASITSFITPPYAALITGKKKKCIRETPTSKRTHSWQKLRFLHLHVKRRKKEEENEEQRSCPAPKLKKQNNERSHHHGVLEAFSKVE